MKPMKNQLSLLEYHLQKLIEGGVARVLQLDPQQNDLSKILAQAMQTELQTDPLGKPISPNLFTVYVAPARFPVLQANQFFLDELTQNLIQAAGESGIGFNIPPVVRLSYDPSLVGWQVRVSARNSLEGLPQTTELIHDDMLFEEIPGNAFLIVDGTSFFPLNRSVINIGRREDNHLVIEDLRVSRVHAQLRAIHGHFHLFDLDSTSGTSVNGKPIHQHVLVTGDVISLAGYPLVYGQDSASETQDLSDLNLPPDEPQFL